MKIISALFMYMKIRLDFITNSSSSSFIIKSKEPLDEVKDTVEKLTKDNFQDAFEAISDFYYGWISDHLTNEEVKKKLNLSDEQLFLMMVAKEDKIDEYLKLKELLESGEENIYFIDYEPYVDDIYDKYISDNEIIMRGGI